MSIFISVVAAIIAFFNLRALLKQNKAIKTIKETLIHLKNAPKFSPDLVNCYVKFKGKVNAKNNYTSPLSQVNCAFYSYSVIAHWTHKKKKPEKGTELQKRLLLQDKSSDTLELVHESGKIVKLRWDDFLKLDKFHRWHTHKQTNKNCPTVCQALAEARFESYEFIENYLLAEEELVVYGKLIRDNTDNLHITHARIKQFPPSLQLAYSKSSELTSLKEDISSKKRKRNFHAILLFIFTVISIVMFQV